MNPSYHFNEVAGFVAGTVGPRGQRTFYLQVRDGSSVVSFRLEKQQVSALADYIANMLVDLPPVDIRSVPDLEALVEPVVAEWIVGGMGIDYNKDVDHFVIMAQELHDEDDSEASAATLRFAIDRGQACAFITQARDLMEAGRPPCPYCSRPWEPAENFCPCHN